MQPVNLSKDQLVSLVGGISDEAVVAILETGATLEEIEEALQWISSADDVMGKSGRELSGRSAAVYDILLAEDQTDERER